MQNNIASTATDLKTQSPTLIDSNSDILSIGKYKLSKKRLFFFLCMATIAIGTLFRILYVNMTAYDISKHDLGYINGLESEKVAPGHLGYIEYIFKHRGLPDFSPTSKWSFYNPPLYHALSAVFLGIFTFLGQTYEAAWESLQFLPCEFILLSVIGAYLTLKELDVDGIPLLIATAIFSFHPTFTYLSLTMNNDPLSLAFSVWAVYFTVRWYKKPTIPSIIGIALCVGLGMMTKLTVALIAPPIAILFIYRFFKDKTWIKTLVQFVIFGVICFPLGLYWSVRNYIIYDIPLGYVQALPAGSPQDVSGFSLYQRIGVPPLSDFTRITSYWSSSGETGATDHNLWSQSLRTALFDDNMLSFGEGGASELAGKALMIFGLLLALLTVVLTVIGLIRAKNTDLMTKIFLSAIILAIVINFIQFCFSFPATCTIHFRYIVYAVPIFSAAVGLWWKNANCNSVINLSVKYLYGAFTICFCVLSAAVYFGGLPTLG